MSKIPESELEALKSSVDLVALARASGVELMQRGRNFIGCCPFHDDTTPSLVVSPDKGLWHCMGACAEGGSVIDWVMKTQGLGFRHAVEVLREGNASSLFDSTMRRKSSVPKLANPLDIEAPKDRLLLDVVEYYSQTLKRSPSALEYLSRRGLGNPELLDHFKLGYADRSLGLRLPLKNREDGRRIRESLQELGIFRSSGHEHFRGSVVVPFFEEDGSVGEVYGRKINEHLREGTNYHLYLPGPHCGLLNPQAYRSESLILCEAAMDALTFWNYGLRNVSACFGAGGFTDGMLGAMLRGGARKAFLAFDADEAGDRAAEKLAQTLNGEGIEVLRVAFPRGQDANSWACGLLAQGKSPAEIGAEFSRLMNLAKWMGVGELYALDMVGTPALPEAARQVPEIAEQVENTASSTLEDLPQNLESCLPGEGSESKPLQNQEQPIQSLGNRATPKTTSLGLPTPLPCARDAKGFVHFAMEGRAWRAGGLPETHRHGSLKVTLRLGAQRGFHLDTLDLCQAKARESFVKMGSSETGLAEDVVRRDLGRIYLALEELLDREEEGRAKKEDAEEALSPERASAALELLRSPRLLHEVMETFEGLGLAGERENLLVLYLACTSRKLRNPLAVVVQSSSSAGKTTLVDAALELMPASEKLRYSSMTGQSLFYMGRLGLRHKVLAVAEEEGARDAGYSLKLLQSDGRLDMAATGKDPLTGRLTTQAYEVEGPVALLMTTTRAELDEELMNRCLTLAVDEGREQTRAVHLAQRKRRTLEGIRELGQAKEGAALHRDAQSLLRPLTVLNPFAHELVFPDAMTRHRRDQGKYLSLIDSVALLHQYQRPVRKAGELEYIEVEFSDLVLAGMLAQKVMGRSLDHLPPQTRRLWKELGAWALGACEERKISLRELRFSRRDLREALPWGDTQLKVHLARLCDAELVLAWRSRRGQGLEYELLQAAEGVQGKGERSENRENFAGSFSELLAKGKMAEMARKYGYDGKWSDLLDGRSGFGRPSVGGGAESQKDTQDIAGQEDTVESVGMGAQAYIRDPENAVRHRDTYHHNDVNDIVHPALEAVP